MVSNGKFVAYYRVSTDRQGRSGLGLEAQRAAVSTYLNGGSWSIIAEFTEVESGRKADRPELDKALAAARLHRAPLVVSKVDRLTRSVAFLSRLLEANVDVRFADLPQIEGATGRFLLQQMVAVAELEAGLISARTKAALTAAKARGKKLGGRRTRISDGKPVAISPAAQKRGAAANRARAADRAADLEPTIVQIRAAGATTLAAIAAGLNEAGIPTPRGNGRWSPVQVKRTLDALGEVRSASQPNH
ncbi:recombinase family protein [Bradyrhizobium sp. 173]|uniref:recombinase family protein n=1 Tax=Bradyrhizobium sp. 173 TaxID=2782644 RepID=UPI001FFB498E|nr:recombinase family protein [Bradyrhizobium sp. 173]MCK1562455.1 recombinase family protein [Bradyrhizobium sp. 173]